MSIKFKWIVNRLNFYRINYKKSNRIINKTAINKGLLNPNLTSLVNIISLYSISLMILKYLFIPKLCKVDKSLSDRIIN